MTGQKNRYTTSEKLWKLNDETLTTPKHDEMVLFMLNVNNIPKIFNIDGLLNFSSKVFTNDYNNLGILFSKSDIIYDTEISSEVPITSKNGFINGYWDIVIKFNFKSNLKFLQNFYEEKIKNIENIHLYKLKILEKNNSTTWEKDYEKK